MKSLAQPLDTPALCLSSSILDVHRVSRIEVLDMQGQTIVRTFLFCVFFSIGAVVMSGSTLCDVLQRYYLGKHLLEAQQQRTNHLKSLIADYNALLEEIEKDPNFAKRIAPATLGTEPNDADTVYPRATVEQLAATRKVLMEDSQRLVKPAIPEWLGRCSEPWRRITLFVAGAVLILISFVCFGPSGQKSTQQ